jgi:hypothetical protein
MLTNSRHYGIRWYSLVFAGICWYLLVFACIRWYSLVFACECSVVVSDWLNNDKQRIMLLSILDKKW